MKKLGKQERLTPEEERQLIRVLVGSLWARKRHPGPALLARVSKELVNKYPH